MIPAFAVARRRTALGLRYLGAAADITNPTAVLSTGNIFTGGLNDPARKGDLIVLAIADYNGTPGLPSGYTSLLTVSETTSYGAYMRVCYRRLTSDWSGVTFGANSSAAVAQAWRGVDPTTPIDVTSTSASHAVSAIADPPSITPVTSGAFILCFGFATNGIISVSGWSGLSNLATDNGSGGGYSGVIAAATYEWSSGAYDPAAWTLSGTPSVAKSAVSATVALRPAT